MDSSVAIVAAERHGYRTAAELVPDRHAHARDLLLRQDALKELVHAP